VKGRVITIASASGGCGKTFFATNLAWFLAHHGARKVCILDFDLQFGEVTASLRLRPRYTVTDLIQQSEESDDPMESFIEDYCEVHETGIHVLAAPREPTDAARLRPDDIGRVIDAARARFDEVIIDTPPALADTVVVAFNRSDELYVMATLDVPSIRNMQVFLGTLGRLDVPTDGIHLILNKAEAGSGVEVRQVVKVFPQGFDATLPYAREVQRSINTGNPVLVTNPSTEISIELGTAMARLLPADRLEAFQRHEAAHRPGRLRRWARKEVST
jgi:pilus assembly protein CpaE